MPFDSGTFPIVFPTRLTACSATFQTSFQGVKTRRIPETHPPRNGFTLKIYDRPVSRTILAFLPGLNLPASILPPEFTGAGSLIAADNCHLGKIFIGFAVFTCPMHIEPCLLFYDKAFLVKAGVFIVLTPEQGKLDLSIFAADLAIGLVEPRV